ARERESLEAERERMRQREVALRQREDQSRKKLAEELESHAREAKKSIEGVIAKLKQKTNAIAEEAAKQRINTGASGAARIEAREAVDGVIARILEPAQGERPAATPDVIAPVSVGVRVSVGGLGLEGVVTALHGGTAEVDVRGKRMRADVRNLRVTGLAPVGASRISVHTELVPRETTPTELNIIGCTVDEALTRVERFMDESLLTDQRVLRFVHGHGTGQLKRAVTGFLRQHPLVTSVSQAPPNQGGGGVTVAELKD
ncbi:MAG: Smr/MutS family protein, partial [Vicinamibacterales bacterium]